MADRKWAIIDLPNMVLVHIASNLNPSDYPAARLTCKAFENAVESAMNLSLSPRQWPECLTVLQRLRGMSVLNLRPRELDVMDIRLLVEKVPALRTARDVRLRISGRKGPLAEQASRPQELAEGLDLALRSLEGADSVSVELMELGDAEPEVYYSVGRALNHMRHLKSLHIESCLLTSPECLAPNLQTLQVDRFVCIKPLETHQLSSLTHLSLCHLLFRSQETWDQLSGITRLTSLQKLELRHLGLTKFTLRARRPAAGSGAKGPLPSLTHLDLSHNAFRDFPKDIRHLTRLVILEVGSNKLAQLPEGITKLTDLRVLGLRDTLIEHLPLLLTQLRGLEAIYFKRYPTLNRSELLLMEMSGLLR